MRGEKQKLLVVCNQETYDEHESLSQEYAVAFELNDFCVPEIICNEEELQNRIDFYKGVNLPEGSTMHGAFFDIIPFSKDVEIARISRERMRRSLEIANELKLQGVVFHLNSNPGLKTISYQTQVVEKSIPVFEELALEFPEVEIYLENMFEQDESLLVEIAKGLSHMKNFSLCLDYAHVMVYGKDPEEWLDKVKPYVKHIHINDNDLKADLHLALSEGKIDYAKFLERVKKDFSDCTIVIETSEPERQRKSLEFVEKWGISCVDKQEAEKVLETIFSYMNKLMQMKSFDDTLVLLNELGSFLVHADRASFWCWNKKKKTYWTLAASETEPIEIPEGTGIVGIAMQQNHAIMINNPYEDERFNASVDQETGYVTKSILCLPVTNENGDVIGAFQVINKKSESGQDIDFDENDIRHLGMVAAYCNKTLESHMLYETAHIDPLTGLKNRRGFFDFFSKKFLGDTEYNPSVIMCDIDFFKAVNDTYGHNGGDAVLVFIADLLQSKVDKNGVVIRWGGEEFLILLDCESKEEVIVFADELRKTIEESVCVFEGNGIMVTMSFGVDQPEFEGNLLQYIKKADENLYEAKKTGRNKVVY